MRGFVTALVATAGMAGCASTGQLSSNPETSDFSLAYDTGRERPVTFAFVAGQAAANLIAQIPFTGTAAGSVAAVSISR